MSFRRVLLPIVAVSCLALLVGCSSSTHSAVPPPSGGFSNNNLSGTYVFSTVGSDINGVFIALTGTFVADGSGGIKSGTIDMNDPNVGVLMGQAVTGGSYSVGVDGRPKSTSGLITLQTAAAVFTFDFVLSSSEHGLITYYDSNATTGGTGSGTLDLQSTVTQSSINGQSYAFNFSGIGSFNTSTGAQTSFASAGAFKLDANGAIGITTTGVEDINTNGLAVCGPSGCTITSGSINLSTTPGTATFTSSAGSFNFDVYPVTPTHLKFIETDATPPIAAGDVFAQSTSVPAANNVFSLAGYDSVVGGPFTAVGLLVTDGAGNVTNASTEDINDSGTADTTPFTYSGSYSTLSGGRAVVTLTGFVNGNGGLGCSSCQFAIYPFSSGGSSGFQMLEIDNAGVTDGLAYTQGSSPTFASSQGYGMNLTGLNNSVSTSGLVEEDDIAEFTNTSGSFAGLIDFNDEGVLTFGKSFTSTYTADTSGIAGRGTVAAGTSTNAYDLVTYVVDSSSAVCIVTDSNMVALGSIETQTASAKSNAAAQHLAVLRIVASPKAGAKKAWKRR
ncbi:exported hypothetical protein [Candidatus Sulfotelmatobacter kueseliae]|uniref:Lipoprotein n=1 Tax=Candidatus Sulfotelmatobacter kueseliae TaxID=2042962 RepID=A0A2U3LAA7_9BACT|nr:exported hypothetical protein [Candidatus Sulfotelmatobacter kueseliae]